MATRSEQIAELETELTALKAARLSALTGGSSVQLGDLIVSGINSQNLDQRITQIEKSLQRLRNGGRGIVVDMSARSDGVVA